MSKNMKKNLPGGVVKIDTGDAIFYGRILREPLIAFYSIKASSPLNFEDVVHHDVIFKLWVSAHAITSGRWEIVGNIKLDDTLKEPVEFFKQDMLSKKLSIYMEGKERPADKAECLGLERAAVWEPQHVEDRLRDHFNNVPNKWVESLRLK